MRVNKLIFLPMLLVVLLSAPQASPNVSPVEAGAGSTSMKRAFTEYYGYSPQVYAQKADMYICHIEVAETGKVQKIHQLRSEMICLLYRNMRTIKPDATEYQLFVTNGWLMKDANGSVIRDTIYNGVVVDKGNPDYQKWVANWIKGYLYQYGFDGVYADRNLYNSIFWGFWGTTVTSGTTGPPINPRTGQAYTNADFVADQLALIKTVKDTIYPKLLICNGVIDGNRFYTAGLADMLQKAQIDGVVSEYLFSNDEYAQWYSETRWKQSVDYVVWLENSFLGSNKILLAGMSHANNPTLPTECTQDQYITFTFASLFLAATNFTQYCPLLGDGSAYGMQDYPQSLFNLDLGSPLNPYYVVSGTHVYARDFTKARILVNPAFQPYQVTLTGNYTTLNGTAVNSPLTVNPHIGLILMKSQQNTASAHIYVEHTWIGDLVVDLGVGNPSNPKWSTRLWNRAGGSTHNLDLTVDLYAAQAYLPPSNANNWFLRVYDAAAKDTGRIVSFNITCQGTTYSSTDVPVPVTDFTTSYAYIPTAPKAHIHIQHTYIGDLIVDTGIGSISAPLWSTRLWNGTGGNTADLDLYVDLSPANAYLPPSSTNTWWVKVYDRAARDTGNITAYTIAYQGKTYSSTDVPVPIYDFKTSYAYIRG